MLLPHIMVLSCSKGSSTIFTEALQSLQGAEELCAYLTGKPDCSKIHIVFSLDLHLISQNVYRIKLRKKKISGNRFYKTERKEKK